MKHPVSGTALGFERERELTSTWRRLASARSPQKYLTDLTADHLIVRARNLFTILIPEWSEASWDKEVNRWIILGAKILQNCARDFHRMRAHALAASLGDFSEFTLYT